MQRHNNVIFDRPIILDIWQQVRQITKMKCQHQVNVQQPAEGDHRSSEGRVDLVINHNDDKENDDKEDVDKKDNNISIIHK